MNNNSKNSAFAGAVGVWWGIYLIIGCCICFSINILLGMFGVKNLFERISLGLLAAFVGAGALVLALLSYAISYAAKTLPEKLMRKKLDKILRKNGICKEYTALLGERLSGDTKDSACTELALACVLSGDAMQAKKYIEQLNTLNVLEKARSTGDHNAAADYYAVSAVIYLCLDKPEIAKTTLENGKPCLDNAKNDSLAAAAAALRLYLIGSDEEAAKAAEEADELRRSTLKKGRSNDVQGFVLGMKAHILYETGNFDGAGKAAEEALKLNISDEFEKYITEISHKIEHPDDNNGKDAELNNNSV